jgi:hypothetical protein
MSHIKINFLPHREHRLLRYKDRVSRDGKQFQKDLWHGIIRCEAWRC